MPIPATSTSASVLRRENEGRISETDCRATCAHLPEYKTSSFVLHCLLEELNGLFRYDLRATFPCNFVLANLVQLE
jgi:hypothetical protein